MTFPHNWTRIIWYFIVLFLICLMCLPLRFGKNVYKTDEHFIQKLYYFFPISPTHDILQKLVSLFFHTFMFIAFKGCTNCNAWNDKMSISCSRSATPPNNFHNFNPIHSIFLLCYITFYLIKNFSQVSLFTIISFHNF